MSDTSTCCGCGEPIRWVLTVDGARMPLNPVSAPEGNVVLVTLPDGKRRARVLTGADCPRRSRRGCRTTAPAPRRGLPAPEVAQVKRCRACGNVLHQLLVDAGETYHAGCYPPADLREQVEAAKDGGGRAQGKASRSPPRELDPRATS